jgi:hypothetical protein
MYFEWSARVLARFSKSKRVEIQQKMIEQGAHHSYHAITGLKSNTSYVTEAGWARELFEEQMPNFDWALFDEWLGNTEDSSKPFKCCPTLWKAPEPDEEKLKQVGPIEIHVGGVNEGSEIITYEKSNKDESKKPNRQEFKKKTRRTPEQQQEFVAKIKKMRLWSKYTSAANIANGDPSKNEANFKIRQEIEALIK